jgi:hypothetical protein
MAILYRAIWTDRGDDLVGRVRGAFTSWVAQKTDDRLDAYVPGEVATSDGHARLRVEYVPQVHDPIHVSSVFRSSLVEESHDGRRWTTIVRSWCANELPGCGPPEQWAWVDVEAVTDDSTDIPRADAPRFVRELLAAGPAPTRLGTPLAATPRRYQGADGADELAELITFPDRDVPIVVFAPMPADFQFRLPPNVTLEGWFDTIVDRAADMTAGLTLVCRLDAAAEHAFPEAIGADYTVRDGAFRVYLPGLDPALDEAWKHRYTVPVRFLDRRDAAGQLINRAIALRASAKRAPLSYEAAAALLESERSKEPAELRELANLAMGEADEYRARLAGLDQRYIESVEELRNLTAENNRLRSDLARAYRERSPVPAAVDEELPDTAESPSDAACMAQVYLGDHLSLPDDACVDLADLDSATEAQPWANRSWLAFRALRAYGEALKHEKDPGTFWTWCENSGNPHHWPATSKKLAMAESKRVRTTAKLWHKRLFPVDTEVSATGRIHMEAHIKIAEGGGLLAPRIYFYASHRLGKVYVGYFGPHKNVPNTLT